MLPLCDYCPIEKSPNKPCHDENGTWTQDTQGNWIFQGNWKCIYYDKINDSCNAPK